MLCGSSCSLPLLLLLFLLLLLLLLFHDVRGYEAPGKVEDVFASKACPAFLSFVNVAYVRGVTVELPCHCKPPKVHSVVWFHKRHPHRAVETVALSDHHGNRQLDSLKVPESSSLQSRFSIRLFSLLIFRTRPDDSGVYLCGSAHQDFFYAYDLDIQEARAISFTTSQSNVSEQREGPAPPHTLFRLFTHFGTWSGCDRCGRRGEEIRYGLCYIHSPYLHVRYRRNNRTVTSCGSGAVPRAFGLWRPGWAEAKMEVRRCWKSCATSEGQPDPPPSGLDAVFDFFQISSSSLADELPVFHVNHPDERLLTLECPGARPYMAVAWDRESQPIYRSQHTAGGGTGEDTPRMTIDTGHHLVFTPAKSQDSGVYYCWLQGRRAAKVELLVYAHFGKTRSAMSHPNMSVALWTLVRYYVAMATLFAALVLGRVMVRLVCCSKHTERQRR